MPQEQAKLEYLIMNDGFISEEERHKLIRKHLPNHGSINKLQEKSVIEAANSLILQGSNI